MEIYQEFSFDAAHRFPAAQVGHQYEGLHGHSFTARVVIEGDPDPATGFVADLGLIDDACAKLRAELDHRYLNDIDGLAVPSLEHIAIWIWNRLKPEFEGLTCVEVRRASRHHGCVYRGPQR